MNLISIGSNTEFIGALATYKNYKPVLIAPVADSFIELPVLGGHEEYEKWASDNFETVLSKFKSLNDKEVTFIISQNNESGVILVLLEACVKLGIVVDVILIRRDFGANIQQKILGKVLNGVLYEFLNKGIDKIYYFSFDMMRKIYKDIKLSDTKEFYNKIALLWHKKNVFLHKPSFLDLTGETKWSITQVNKILSLPRLIILSSVPVPDETFREMGLEIYRMVYYISYAEERLDDKVEEYVQEVSHVVREFKIYSLGDDVLTEFYLKHSMNF